MGHPLSLSVRNEMERTSSKGVNVADIPCIGLVHRGGTIRYIP